MGFDNKYPNRKDWLKPYYRSKRFDRTCRPNGSCGYCVGNRTHRHKRHEPADQILSVSAYHAWLDLDTREMYEDLETDDPALFLAREYDRKPQRFTLDSAITERWLRRLPFGKQMPDYVRTDRDNELVRKYGFYEVA